MDTDYTVRRLGASAFTLVDRHSGSVVSDLFVGSDAQQRAEAACAEANTAGHVHDMTEDRMSDCAFGCKVYRCWCGAERVAHSATYGCPTGGQP